MIYICTLLSILFLPILSLKEIKPKLCINCKYFITDNLNSKFGKCTLFTKQENNMYSLVNGISENKNNEYHYCNVARLSEQMCGKEGKMYKKKYIKKVNLK
jgi:hypothetical protein